ncbi:NRDE family protein [Fodinicurvata halophila]|uniref:NRDE family protein n=1 Tax=Fodinicurvata halophila TaxID=1419723 RepID=UPI00363834BC
MCTLVIDRAPGHDWPILLAGNRDEMRDRSWKAPGRHWPDRPHVVAGQDLQSEGAWLGLNDDGLVAAVLNRYGSLGSTPERRSRGELVLEALDHAEATAAAEALADLEPQAYRSFNLVVADALDAFWIRHSDEEGRVSTFFPSRPACRC